MEDIKDKDVQTEETSEQLSSEVISDLDAPPTLTISDIQTMVAVINLSSERGGFRGAELKTVGELHTKLVQFLAWAQKAQADQEEANAEEETKKDTSEEK